MKKEAMPADPGGVTAAMNNSVFADAPVVFFSPAFLSHPGDGWSVRRSRQNGQEGKRTKLGKRWSGTVVTLHQPHRVWRLTGKADVGTGCLEGRLAEVKTLGAHK
jgi:hypothetical protein